VSGKNLYRLHISPFQTESKKKKRTDTGRGKVSQVLFYLNTTYPQFPVLCVSARQKGKNLGSAARRMGRTVVFAFQKENPNIGA
jgi:hypothetical protein